MERITTAVAGEEVTIKLRYDSTPHNCTVGQPCELKNNGLWYCLTHRKGFDNQMQKDGHISEHGENGPRAKHKLAWLCFAHGPEQP